MEDVLNYVSKDWLVTDECDPTDDGYLGRSKSSESTMPSGPCGVGREGECPSFEVYRETPEPIDLKNNQSLPRGSESCNPFEIEPGHFDFLQVSEVYSRPFSSGSISRKGSSTKGDSSSSTRRCSNQSASTSGSVGNPKLSKFMANWVEDTSVVSTQKHCDLPAIEYNSSGRIKSAEDLPKPCLSRVPPITRVGVQPSRVRAQPNRVLAQPLLANYTLEEVEAMTGAANNQVLGRGGFGGVFMGILASNKQVAVKILDDASRQGDSEFLNEVDLLSRVNHVNLVKLLGYCQDGSARVLVYEYAEEGTLWDHIHGNGSFLDWKTRLKVSLESAFGLEYLHTGCSPRIIHRDIKSSNILLTKHLVAKVADFGLSKMGVEDDNDNRTHISTVVKGTPGYLDPEYYKTAQLNEKSDIFSFGVILLEIITGRNPIDKNADVAFIGDWVKAQWKSGGAKGVVDSRLGGAYNIKSMKAVVTLALKCIETSAKSRPDIRKVVEQLRAAIVLEDNTLQASRWSLRSLLGQT